ncbi:hypothetical protein [Streptomyces sp. NPDC090445]|uniref:hypothetical protein n=1 Tax=Streptomyces sp. NPDC090445 TaxID=3365963 RepID=UPI00381653D8
MRAHRAAAVTAAASAAAGHGDRSKDGPAPNELDPPSLRSGSPRPVAPQPSSVRGARGSLGTATGRRRAWAVAVAVVVALTGVSCTQPNPGSDHGSTEQEQEQEPNAAPSDSKPSAGTGESDGTTSSKKPACPTPGPLTRSQLPGFPPADEVSRINQNPCVPLARLADQILGFVPKSGNPRYTSFRNGLGQFVGKLDAANDVAKCAYETDRLAVGVYQHKSTPWSIGMVAVVRKDLKGIVDVGACWLPKRLPFPPPTQGIAPDEIKPDYCADAVTRKSNGHTFTIMWIGSSNVMCGSLDRIYRKAPS